MTTLNLTDPAHGHKFEKVNLITTSKGDQYICKNCALSGWRRTLAPIIEFAKKNRKIKKCPGASEQESFGYKKIKVIKCQANGKQFENLTPGSIHAIVDPPDEFKEKYPNSNMTVWVDGFDEPVRLLGYEFDFVE